MNSQTTFFTRYFGWICPFCVTVFLWTLIPSHLEEYRFPSPFTFLCVTLASRKRYSLSISFEIFLSFSSDSCCSFFTRLWYSSLEENCWTQDSQPRKRRRSKTTAVTSSLSTFHFSRENSAPSIYCILFLMLSSKGDVIVFFEGSLGREKFNSLSCLEFLYWKHRTSLLLF